MQKLIVALFFMASQVSARTEISIDRDVEVSQRQLLRLSDLVKVVGGTEELITSLDSVVVREDSRELLLSQHLTSEEILKKVRQAILNIEAIRVGNPSFKIPSQVKVTFSSTPISQHEVERKLTNVLKSRCPSCEYKVSLQSTPVPLSANWELDFSQITGKGGFLLPLIENGKAPQKWISGTIRTLQLTPVASRLILQGERVQPGDVRLVLTDVTFAKDAVLRIEDVQGQSAVRSLAAGTPMWASDLKREPAAKKGQIVKAVLGDETLEISLNLLAEDNGFVGDVVKLKNLENQKVLTGIVVEKGVVRLQ